jgi:hypothetical protein
MDIQKVTDALNQFSDGTHYRMGIEDLRNIINENPVREKPKRAPSAFFLWKSDNKEFIMSKIEKNGKGVMASKAGELWKLMDDSDKEPYIEKANEMKDEYMRLIKDFRTDVVVSSIKKSGRGRPKLSDEEKAARKKARVNSKKNQSNETDESNMQDHSVESSEVSNADVVEVEVNVEEFNYQGKSYLLDTNSGDIYDVETEEIIGLKKGEKVTFN